MFRVLEGSGFWGLGLYEEAAGKGLRKFGPLCWGFCVMGIVLCRVVYLRPFFAETP